MEGSGGSHAPGGPASDAEESDDGGQMHDSDAQGAANAAQNKSHVSEDDASDIESPLPVKRRSTGAAAGKASRPSPQRGGARAPGAEHVGDEAGSDIETPMTIAGSKPSKNQPPTKKRSKAQLEVEESPSASPGTALLSIIMCHCFWSSLSGAHIQCLVLGM